MNEDEARELLVYAAQEWGLGPLAAELVLEAWQRSPSGRVLEPRDDRPKSRTSDPGTSRAADARNEHGKRGSQRLRLAEALEAHAAMTYRGGLTAEQLATRTGIPLNAASTRLSELERDGLIFTGPDTRETSTGAQASIYRISTAGRERLAARRQT